MRSTRRSAELADLPRRMRRLAGPGGCTDRAGDSPDGGVALFADLDMPRFLVGAGSGGRAGARPHFLLDMGRPCVLGYSRYIRAVRVWNGPLTG
jgi:hypothetical protein